MTTPNEKVVRANFTILQKDLDLIAQVKKRCLLLGIETNKSELIRGAIDAFSKLSDNKLRDILKHLPKPKVGGKRLKREPESII